MYKHLSDVHPRYYAGMVFPNYTILKYLHSNYSEAIMRAVLTTDVKKIRKIQ
jgi:hypothetical protein